MFGIWKIIVFLKWNIVFIMCEFSIFEFLYVVCFRWEVYLNLVEGNSNLIKV